MSSTENYEVIWKPQPGPQVDLITCPTGEIFFGGARGGGKAQPLDCLVLTPVGWVAMGDLNVGDRVFAFDGTPSRILAVFDRPPEQVYEVRTTDGGSTRTSADHLWVCEDARSRGPNRKFGRKLTTLELRERVLGNNRPAIPTVEPMNFKQRCETGIDPYLLGQLLGDGYINPRGSRVTTGDEETAKRLESLGLRIYEKKARDTPYYDCVCSNKNMPLTRDWLVQHGLMDQRSEFKFIPIVCFTWNANERWELLRGLLDSDGWVSGIGTCMFQSTSKRLAEDVRTLGLSLGAVCSLTGPQAPSYKNKRGERVPGKPSWRVNLRFWNCSNAFGLERKKQRAIDRTSIDKRPLARPICSVEPLPDLVPTRCIQIDHPSSLYVTDDYVVTHNTDAVIGKFVYHANKYGDKAHGVMFRRTFKQLEEVLKRTRELYPKIGATYSVTAQTWTFPNGATLKLRHLDNEVDAQSYQGHQYCVQEDTPIRMADGSLRPIRDVHVGAYVATLAGPRQVTRTHGPWKKPCIRVSVRSLDGELLGEQVQPLDHRILTSVSTLQSPRDELTQGAAPLQIDRAVWSDYISLALSDPDSRRDDEFGSYLKPSYTAFLQRCLTNEPLQRIRVRGLIAPRDPSLYVRLSVSKSTLDLSLSFELYSHEPDVRCLETRRKDTSLDLNTQQSEQHLAQTSKMHHDLHVDGEQCEPIGFQTPAGSEGHCSEDYDPCDGLLLLEVRDALDASKLPTCAGELNRLLPSKGGEDSSPSRSHQVGEMYLHPYTQEPKRSVLPLEEVELFFEACGDQTVRCLTVDDSNHYITESGCVNSQTFLVFEEVTNWATSRPMDMLRGTLRSAAGVPPQLVLTGNPGGPGHNWVKQRYIVPARNGYKLIVDPESGLERVFIPSKLTDNKVLVENDPLYAARLRQTGPGFLVKAWLEGDWDVVAGGFFDDVFNAERHVLSTFPLMPDWPIVTSFDWGLSSPASLGIFVKVTSQNDQLEQKLGRHFPRGSLIRIRELYTVKRDEQGYTKANEGLRLNNEELGARIARKLKVLPPPRSYVADPSIFNEQGGPSIYEQMRRGAQQEGYKLVFNKADNNRPAGWSKMRELLQNANVDRPERAGLWIFDSCEDWLRTVPTIQADRLNPDDVDTDAEDHAADDTRYAVMIKSRIPIMTKFIGG